MNTLERLQAELSALEAERERLKSEGWCLQNCWLVQVKPGGTARTKRQYWQVRSRQSIIEGNKKLKHLKPEEVEDYKAAIARGQKLKQIDRQIEVQQQQISQFSTTQEQLSISLKLNQGKKQRQLELQPKRLMSLLSDIEQQDVKSEQLIAQSKRLRALLQQSYAQSQKLAATTLRLQERFTLLKS